MTNGNRGNTNYTAKQAACAACKFQRRKCAPNCILAPYFPAHKQKDFFNAQKLFGVSNIQKAIEKSMPDQRDWTVQSIIFHANARANDPVLGCLPIIMQLQRDIKMAQKELRFVQHQNEMFRAQAAAIQFQPHPFQADDVLNVADGFDDTSLDHQDPNLFDGIPVKTQTEGPSSSSLEKRFPVLGEEGEPLFGQFDENSAAFLNSNDNRRDKDVNPVHHEQEQDKDAVSPFHKK